MWSYHDDLVDTRHRFRRSELASLLKQAGFEITISSYANLLIFPLIIARRKIFVPANPSSDVCLAPGQLLIVLGSAEQLGRFADLLGESLAGVESMQA
jgi:hypothetical protein